MTRVADLRNWNDERLSRTARVGVSAFDTPDADVRVFTLLLVYTATAVAHARMAS